MTVTNRWMRLLAVATAVLVCGFVPAGTARAQESYTDIPELPDGIEGERIEALIAYINANDPELVAPFFEQHCTCEFFEMAPLEMHQEVLADFHSETGGVDFHSIREYDPVPPEDRTVVIVEDRKYGGWRGLVIHFTAADERLIAGLRFADARTPSNVDEPPLTENECMSELGEFLGLVCADDAFSGTVLVANERDILFTHVCGEASKRFGVPNDMDTRFNLGSMNKMFTATAIMQLVERGELSLDDPISGYVDETWLPREITDRVTIHHLLTHTSGLGSYFNEAYDRSSRKLFRAVDDYKPLVAGDTLAFEPGTEFRYSNTGMLLLGVVIESVTGGSYFDYISENVYGPAGMTRTGCYDMDLPVDNLAMGYEKDSESPWIYRNNLYEHVIRGGPAGGGFSTSPDMHRFAVALLSGTLVSQESLDLMWTTHSDGDYGYGFGVGGSAAGKVVGHGGGFYGINANLDIFVDSGYIAVVMSNYGRAARPVATKIQELLGRVADAP